jgi:hypothetical protein
VNDPLLDLLVESLNLIHPRFALAYGREYGPADTEAAARRERERPFLLEFYHQFRHLWERGLPGRLGLGHIVVQGELNETGPLPDLLLWRLGEHGQPDTRLAAVSLAFLSNEAAQTSNLGILARFRTVYGYPHAVSILVGQVANLPANFPRAEGVSCIFYDIDRRAAKVLNT